MPTSTNLSALVADLPDLADDELVDLGLDVVDALVAVTLHLHLHLERLVRRGGGRRRLRRAVVRSRVHLVVGAGGLLVVLACIGEGRTRMR